MLLEGRSRNINARRRSRSAIIFVSADNTCVNQGAKSKHFDVSNVIYHKFSHGTVSYTLNGENVNVMLVCQFLFTFPAL